MPKFMRCPKSIDDLAEEILREFESHKPLLDARVKIDLVFAYADVDDDGKMLNHALTKNGIRALGIARKMPLKDRAMGRGDAEISLDHDWWETVVLAEQRALLDHELHHLAVKIDKRGLVRDDLGRPVLQLRKHDYEIGLFNVIAERHKANSQEVKWARHIMDAHGQLYWSEISGLMKDQAALMRIRGEP